MADGARYSRALILGASVVSIAAVSPVSSFAQTADQTAQSSKPAKPKQAKRNPAKPQAVQPQQASTSVWDARAQAIVGVQALDTITAAASKTEERAVDALAPVSVVTSSQIQSRQASTVGDLIYNVPGVWVQNRGDEPSTSINIRGLQDFGRVAVVVDGARQNYQRTGHFANGSFFLNPELISGIDIVRGPTANIYGSGAIGGVASFRTKDIEDVVRAGERWGVDVKTILGSNYGRALGSAFGGVHVNPNVDVFAGGTYSTQESYKDGTGFEVANTGNRLTSGIAKLTVRPADGHEIKLGTIFQEDIYSVGQPPRRAGDPNSTNANGDQQPERHVDLQVRRQELHHDARLEIFAAGRPVVRLGCEGLLESHRERPGQDRAYQHDAVGLSAAACPAMPCPAVSAATADICSIRSASTCTTPRASIPAAGVTR